MEKNIKIKNNILMITGSYPPEISGANLQCRDLVRGLGKENNFSILTFTNIYRLRGYSFDRKVSIYRMYIGKLKILFYIINFFKIFFYFLKNKKKINIVHFHGFTKKNILIILLVKLFRYKSILKFSSYGYDDPVSIKKNFFLNFLSFYDKYICVSPAFYLSSSRVGLDKKKINLIPNFIRINKKKIRKASIKKFNKNYTKILFVGYFSRDKKNFFAYEAWKKSFLTKKSYLIFIGKSRSNYHEIDEAIKKRIISDAKKYNLLKYIHFVEKTESIEKYFKISNIFLMPSIREGLSNALLEAMFFNLECICTRIKGVNDWIKFDKLSLINKNKNQTFWSKIILRKIKKKKIKKNKVYNQLKMFNSENIFNKYLKLYNEFK